MKLPRDLSGCHLRLTTAEHGEHHVTVPAHKVLSLGTLRSVLREVARHAGLTPEEIVQRLFS